MAVNTVPVFTKNPLVGLASPAGAVPSNAPTTVGEYTIFSQGATTLTALNLDGMFIDSLYLAFSATIAVTSLPGLFRLFVLPSGSNNGFLLLDEIPLPIITMSTISPSQGFNVPIQKAIPAGFGLACNLTVAEVAGRGWKAVVNGGFY